MAEDKVQKKTQRELGYQPVKESPSTPTPPKGGSGVPPKPKTDE